MIDLLATEPHFIDHLWPVWERLKRRGGFYVRSSLLSKVLTGKSLPLPYSDRPVLVASYGDAKRALQVRRRVVLMEHGAGQSYGNGHQSYAGGRGQTRSQIGLFLAPNRYAASRNALAYPEKRTEIVGCPKLDRYAERRFARQGEPTIAVSFHWNCQVTAETRTAFPFFQSGLVALAERFKVLGHAHPRAFIEGRIERFYRRRGIEVVKEFREILERADVYACDNSSTIFEFAATDRPVILLNAPWYRRDVEHGLRFWEFSSVGVQCDGPVDLVGAVERALADTPKQQRERRRIAKLVYPYMGRAAVRAARVIEEWL